GIEAGVWSAQDAERLVSSGMAERCLRVLVEPVTEDVDEALRRVGEIEATLGDLPVPQLHHGDGQATWALIEAAVPNGRDVRIGLEDTVRLPDGRAPRDNAELVAAALELVAG
ncbi:MAG: 3-keto-5-aminohexanoate cleavage protein, partial [Solirubrobacteraceae bacterium]